MDDKRRRLKPKLGLLDATAINMGAIKPAVDVAKGMEGDLLNNSIDVNTQNVVNLLNSSEPILSLAVKQGKLKVLGGRYHLGSGEVTLLEPSE